MFAMLFYFVTLCSVGWSRLPRGFRARTFAHVPTAFPLSFFPCTFPCSTVCIRWYAAGSKRKCAPTSVGVTGALSYLAELSNRDEVDKSVPIQTFNFIRFVAASSGSRRCFNWQCNLWDCRQWSNTTSLMYISDIVDIHEHC